MDQTRISPVAAFLGDAALSVAAKQDREGFGSLTDPERTLVCVWSADGAVARGRPSTDLPAACREHAPAAFHAIEAPQRAEVVAGWIRGEIDPATAARAYGAAREDTRDLLLRHWLREVPGAREELRRRTSDLPGLFFWVAAWIGSAWVATLSIDWSFGAAVPWAPVLAAALVWAGVGVAVVVQLARNMRWAHRPRRLVLALTVPAVVLAQALLMAGATGPPGDLRLMTEFRAGRDRFEALCAMSAVDHGLRSVVRGVEETDPPAAIPKPRYATYQRLMTNLNLEAMTRPRRPGWIELRRWSRGSGRGRVEEGFVHTVTPPEDLVEIVDDSVPPGASSVYRPLEDGWYLFHRAW